MNEANNENNPDKIEKAISILDKLKSAFEEILKNPEYQEAQNFNRTEQVQNAIQRFV